MFTQNRGHFEDFLAYFSLKEDKRGQYIPQRTKRGFGSSEKQNRGKRGQKRTRMRPEYSG